MSHRRRGLLALIATGVALAWTIQPPGMMQNSHYALMKALADGTAQIDATIGDVGDLGTNDVVTHDGHRYSNKAPGLAALAVPAYLVLDAAGVRTTGDPRRMLWALALVVSVLPAFGLLLLVRWAGDRVEPGFGAPASVALGLGTLLLPFAPLLLSHVAAAALVFAAFALLWRERDGDPRLRLVLAGGLVAGLATVVEYSALLAAGLLGAYAIFRTSPLRRVAAYGAGWTVGVAPLLAYNAWAFDSPLRFSYQLALRSRPDLSELPARAHPRADVFFDVLLADNGLLRLAPVLVLGAFALLAVARRGFAREAAAAGAIVAAYLVYSSSFGASFAGFGPGPRFAIPALPFLGFGVAVAFRRVPLVTWAFACVSAATMTAIAATGTLGAYDGRWFGRLGDGDVMLTAASLVGVTGWYAVLPLFAAALAAGALAWSSTPRKARDPTELLRPAAAADV